MSLLIGQFDFGGRSAPQSPPRLRLELAQIGRATGGRVRMRVSLVNRGGGWIAIDPAMLEGDLTEIAFLDARMGRRIVPTVGNERALVPLRPDRAVSLGPGFHFGFERAYTLPRDAAGLRAVAGTGYPKKEARGLVWSGSLRSNTVRLVGAPSRRR